jgi:hypothetical protein
MSSFPPVGGITRRSRIAVSTAPIVTLHRRRFAAQIRFANRSPASDRMNGNRWQSPSSVVDLRSDGRTAHCRFDSRASAAAYEAV